MPLSPRFKTTAARPSIPLLTVAALTLATAAIQPAHAATLGTTYSGNWSGYAATAPTNSTFTDIIGSWNVPAVTGSATSDSYSATWIGIDGFGSNAKTVEQIGTASQYVGGVATYYPWVEYFPDAEVNLSTYFTVNPGDAMSAEVTYTGLQGPTDPDPGMYRFVMTIVDFTKYNDPNYKGPTAAVTINYDSATAPALASAEWITEAPGLDVDGNAVQSTLANYGTVNFTDDGAALDGGDLVSIDSLDSTDVDMVQDNQIVSLATALANDGENFSTIYIAPVPEPASLAMLAFGGIALLRRRRKN